MSSTLDATLAHLRALVAFDTRNPPRAIGTGGIFDYLRAQLPGFDIDVSDHGAGAVSLFAVRGGLRVSKPTSTRKWASVSSSSAFMACDLPATTSCRSCRRV